MAVKCHCQYVSASRVNRVRLFLLLLDIAAA